MTRILKKENDHESLLIIPIEVYELWFCRATVCTMAESSSSGMIGPQRQKGKRVVVNKYTRHACSQCKKAYVWGSERKFCLTSSFFLTEKPNARVESQYAIDV